MLKFVIFTFLLLLLVLFICSCRFIVPSAIISLLQNNFASTYPLVFYYQIHYISIWPIYYRSLKPITCILFYAIAFKTSKKKIYTVIYTVFFILLFITALLPLLEFFGTLYSNYQQRPLTFNLKNSL